MFFFTRAFDISRKQVDYYNWIMSNTTRYPNLY